jgi:DNA polymerase-3 subunit epsilon
MSRVVSDGCGCFPTGRHYPGISHMLRTTVQGLVPDIAADTPWSEIEIALVDLETTGRDASVDRVVEVGVVVGRGGEVILRKNWMVNPGIPIPEQASAVHGIKDADVAKEPRFPAIAAELAEVLRGRVPAAYNAQFDRAFLLAEFGRAEIATESVTALRRDVSWLDPLVWAREIQQGEKSRALGDVAARLGISLEKAHRASEDAEAALRVLYALGTDGRVPRSYGALVQEQRRLALAQADERRLWRS